MDDTSHINDTRYTKLLRQQRPEPDFSENDPQNQIEQGLSFRQFDPGGGPAIRPVSDTSMTPNLPEEPMTHVPLDLSASSVTTPLGRLTLDSRKRPPGSEVYMTDRSTRHESPAKVTRKSSGTGPSSPDTYGRSPRVSSFRPFKTPSPHQAFSPHRQPPYRSIRNTGADAFRFDAARPPAILSPIEIRDKPRQTHRSSHGDGSRPTGAERTVEDAIADYMGQRSGTKGQTSRLSRSKSVDSPAFEDGDFPSNSGLLKQPESRPITEQQLAAEVKGIYHGLVMVETQCIDAINKQATLFKEAEAKGKEDTAAFVRHVEFFQKFIVLHRTLLQEQHDFFLASQHPSATPTIKNLASRYAMPARMWKHGIHNFLELLRARLPYSLDYMLAFIYLAFQMMALLYETVPSFEETWIECLGDLARYRMAIEEEDLRDREIWTGVARLYYLKAVEKNANVGRLYHHLAILARSHPLQQVSLYCRSLTANQPFLSTRESILTLFSPTLVRFTEDPERKTSIETLYVTILAIMYKRKEAVDQLEGLISKFLSQLDDYINRMSGRWKDVGISIGTAAIGALLKYGSRESRLCKILASSTKMVQAGKEVKPDAQPAQIQVSSDKDMDGPDELQDQSLDDASISHEWRLLSTTFEIVLQRLTDDNVLPHVHLMLVFHWRLASTSKGLPYILRHLPLSRLVTFLNILVSASRPQEDVLSESFILPAERYRFPLQEDYAIRGQVWSNDYFPKDWFDTASSDYDERYMEPDWTTGARTQRILWLASRLASKGSLLDEQQKQKYPWIHVDTNTKFFSMINATD